MVEAAEKSGALITANTAIAQGKDVYAPPHEINSITGKGSNKLLLKDAKMYLEPSQLLFESYIKKSNKITSTEDILPKKCDSIKSPKNDIINLSPIEKKILTSINNVAKSIEVISMETQIDQMELIEYLFEMELDGKITALAGGIYRKVPGTNLLTY